MANLVSSVRRVAVYFVAVMLPLMLAACSTLDTPIESLQFSTPTIAFVAPVGDTIDTYKLPGGSGQPNDNVVVHLTVSVRAHDSLGISSVVGTVLSPAWVQTNEPSTVLTNFSLVDDGTNGDQMAGDGIYTANVSFEIFRYEIGTYHLRLQSVNTQGTASSAISIPVYLINSHNHAPVIDSVSAVPDTLTLVDTAISVGAISARVIDPESRRDILSVTARATKPDGTLAGTVVTLYDDGSPAHADAVNGDNFYSSGIKLDPHASPPPEKGSYVFHFEATDKSGAVGRDSITVVVQ